MSGRAVALTARGEGDLVCERAVLVFVVSAAAKGPGVRVDARVRVGRGAEVETRQRAISSDTVAAAGRCMRRMIVDRGVGRDRAGRIGLADGDLYAAALVDIVAGHIGEHPVGRATRDIREAGAQVHTG